MASAAELTSVLAELQRLQRELIELSYVRRSDGLERTGEALRRLGEVGSPAGVLARSAEELGTSADLDRVLVSRLDGEQLRPLAIWTSEGPQAADAMLAALAERSIPVRYPLIEADVLQRHDALVVSTAASGPRAQPDLAEIAGWESYVVVALLLEGKAVGLLHADRTASGRPLDELDVELAAHYADGLGQVFERAVLREKLQRQRSQLESAARWINGQVLHLEAEETPRSAAGLSGDEAELEDVLTPRELEVLELLARGQSNRAIATNLMLGEGTVKYHVKNVLRKLQARSRTEAVARYMRTSPGPDAP